MSNVQELRKMFENKTAQNGPPIKVLPEKPTIREQPKEEDHQQHIPQKGNQFIMPKPDKKEQTTVDYEEPRMSVADLKKNFQAKLNFMGGSPPMFRQPKEPKSQQDQHKNIQQDVKKQTQQEMNKEKIPAFHESKQMLQRLTQRIRLTNLQPPNLEVEEKVPEPPKIVQPNFTKKKREQSYIPVQVKDQEELTIQQRVNQVIFRIFGQKELQQVQKPKQEVQKQQSQKPTSLKGSLKTRGQGNKGKRNLGAFDDA